MTTFLTANNTQATISVKTTNTTSVAKTWAELSDSEKQTIAGEWVAQHVNINVNQVMELLAQNEDHCDFEEYMSIASHQDYEEVSIYAIEALDHEGLNELAAELDVDDMEELTQADLLAQVLLEVDMEEYAQLNDLEPEYNEAYEFYSVSTHFTSMLEDKEKCSDDILGLSVWARYCTGQSITIDHNIQVAAFKALSNTCYKNY